MKKISILLLSILCYYSSQAFWGFAISWRLPHVPAVQPGITAVPNLGLELPDPDVATETALFVYNHLYERKHKVPERQMEKYPIIPNVFPDDDHPIASQIACDGSESTTFKFLTPNPGFWTIKIKENADAGKYGQLGTARVSSNSDSLIYDYKHPQYFADAGQDKRSYIIHLELYRFGVKITSLPIKIVRPPLIMLHGIFADTRTFAPMHDRYVELDLYDGLQMYRCQFINDGHILINAVGLMGDIYKTLDVCYRKLHISTAKVDLVCHSMGGLIARTYLQSGGYSNDVNRLITINTPHSGSQICNLLLDSYPPVIAATHPLVRKFLGDPYNGAAADMRVNSDFIKDLNARKGENHVPIHVIGTFLDNQFLTQYLQKTKFEETHGTLVQLIFISARMAASMTQELFVNTLYDGDNHDLIVPYKSQMGGLTGANSYHKDFQNILHFGEISHVEILDWVRMLLDQDPNGIFFTPANNLNPPKLNIHPITGILPESTPRLSASTISIDSITPGNTVAPGDTVLIHVSASSDINEIHVVAGGAGSASMYFEMKPGSSDTFTYKVPIDAVGKIDLVAMGFNGNGLAGMDTSKFIMVNPISPLISFSVHPDSLLVSMGLSCPLVITGLYGDGVERNITNLPGFIYSSKNNNLFYSGTGKISATKVGTDTITISYQGNSISVPAVISDPLFKGNGVQVSVKAFLQGPFNSSTGLMTDSLRAKSLLPGSEPYQALGFTAKSNSTFELPLEGVFDSTGNKALNDWVWLELRSSTDPAKVISTRSAFIRRDGHVVDMDGVSPVYFNDVLGGSYYVAIRHRNHLGVMTASVITLNDTATTAIDFTSAATPTYGTNARRNLNGVMVMWAGDVNGDNLIRYNGASNDKNAVLIKAGLITPNNVVTGYLREDVNLDGKVRYNGPVNDKNIILSSVGLTTPNNVIVGQIPN